MTDYKKPFSSGPLLNTGFHFNVGNWPGHVETAGVRNGTCSWILSSKDLTERGSAEGIFLSIVHWYPPRMQCTYLIQGYPNQIVRVYFPRYISWCYSLPRYSTRVCSKFIKYCSYVEICFIHRIQIDESYNNKSVDYRYLSPYFTMRRSGIK